MEGQREGRDMEGAEWSMRRREENMEGGRETYEGAWEWRIEGGKRGKNMREEGRHMRVHGSE